MRSPRLVLLGLLTFGVTALGVTACPDPAGKPQVSDDPRVQMKYELARRALADIKLARARRRNFYADCRAVQLLASQELRKSKRAELRKLVEEIDELCKGVPAY